VFVLLENEGDRGGDGVGELVDELCAGLLFPDVEATARDWSGDSGSGVCVGVVLAAAAATVLEYNNSGGDVERFVCGGENSDVDFCGCDCCGDGCLLCRQSRIIPGFSDLIV